jgi:hypothetical protein
VTTSPASADVGYHQRADAVGDLADAFEVDHARMKAADDHLRLRFFGDPSIRRVDPLIVSHAVRTTLKSRPLRERVAE